MEEKAKDMLAEHSLGFAQVKGTLRSKYLRELKRFQRDGIRILIDGIEKPDTYWHGLLGVCEEGGFYMADFGAAAEGDVREIRFDRVYLRNLCS